MYKRLLTFLLVLCLAVSAMPTIPTLAATPQYNLTTADAQYNVDYLECDCFILIIIIFVDQYHDQYCNYNRLKGVQRTNAQGVVLRNYRYTAFGVEISPDSNNGNPWRFNSMYWDSHRREYMTPNRMFSPRTGRWTQPDPFFHVLNGNINDSPLNILQAGNLFVFAVNNPVMWIDPSGLVIELSGTAAQQQTMLSYLQKLTDHQLGINSYGHVYISVRATREMNNLFAHGNALIERMIASDHLTRIMITADVNRVGLYYGPTIGYLHIVRFNPNSRPYTYTAGSSGIASLTAIPLHIILAHELIHSDRFARGVSFEEGREVVRWQSYGIGITASFPPGLSIATIRNRRENTPLEEWATIGLGHQTANCITENMIRQEHGLQRRVAWRGINR